MGSGRSRCLERRDVELETDTFSTCRNDSTKQTMSSTARPTSSYLGGGPPQNSLASLSSLSISHTSTSRSSLLRLTTTESNELELNVETLRDLFWTLYSKLDAVLQGFRVAYEVATRIAERRDFKDGSIVKSQSGNLLFSLLDVWKPVQTEVRALLHDYLTDDQTGTVSSRNPIVSVNEVLRLAKPRDASKVSCATGSDCVYPQMIDPYSSSLSAANLQVCRLGPQSVDQNAQGARGLAQPRRQDRRARPHH